MNYIKSVFGYGNKNVDPSTIELDCSLWKKEKGSELRLLSVEVSLEFVVDSNFEYSIEATNKVGQSGDGDWKDLSFRINGEMELLTLNNNFLSFFKGGNYFLIEFLEESDQKEVFDFIQALCNLILSNVREIEYSKVDPNEAKGFIRNHDETVDLNDFLEERLIHRQSNPGYETYESKEEQVCFSQDFVKDYPNAKLVLEAEGVLCIYDSAADDIQELSAKCMFGVFNIAEFTYALVVSDKDQTLISCLLSASTSITVKEDENVAMWLANGPMQLEAFQFIFAQKEVIGKVSKVISACLFEEATKQSATDLKEEEQEFMEEAFKGAELPKFEDNQEEDFAASPKKYEESDTVAKNINSFQGIARDSTFLIKEDNRIEVYAPSEGEKLKVTA